MKNKNGWRYLLASFAVFVLPVTALPAGVTVIKSNYSGKGAVVNGPGSYTIDSFDIRVPKGKEAEIRIRVTDGYFFGGAGDLRLSFAGGHDRTYHMVSGSKPYECTVTSNTSLSLIPWIIRLDSSYETRRVDLPNGTIIYMPVGGYVSSYAERFEYQIDVSYIKRFKVTFEGCGGTVSARSREYVDGRLYGDFPVVERKGYRLLGWYTAKTGGTNVFVPGSKASAKVTKLYARWTRCKYKVRFNANGGSGKMAKQTFSYGKYSNLRANAFTRKGYSFSGWAKSKSGKVAYANKKKVRNLTSTDGAVVNLYAVWKAKSYELTVKVDGKGKVDGAGKHACGKRVKLTAVPKSGFVFAGWYRKDGKKTLATERDYRVADNTFTMPASSTTVVARFVKRTKASGTLKLSCNPATGGYTIGKAMSLKVVSASMTEVCFSATGLPPGLKFDSSTGNLSGTPSTAGSFLVKVKATDALGETRAIDVTIKVDIGPLPDWAIGNFVGYLEFADGVRPVQMTVGRDGKMSGKFRDGWMWTAFSATGYTGKAEDGSLYTMPFSVKVNGVTKSLTLEARYEGLTVKGTLTGVLGLRDDSPYWNIGKSVAGRNATYVVWLDCVSGGNLQGSYMPAGGRAISFYDAPVFGLRVDQRGMTVTELYAVIYVESGGREYSAVCKLR